MRSDIWLEFHAFFTEECIRNYLFMYLSIDLNDVTLRAILFNPCSSKDE